MKGIWEFFVLVVQVFSLELFKISSYRNIFICSYI